ncbi:MAG: hypothetical protein AAGI23_16420 [Bacteroidota bacterium]
MESSIQQLMHLKLVLFFLTLLSCIGTRQLTNKDRIQINIPTPEAEAAYVWRNLQDIPFFEQHGYQVSLPSGMLIEELKQKVRDGNLPSEDYGRLEQFIRDSVYQASDYQKGYEKIKAELALINKMVNEIEPVNFDWTFKTFDTYQVNLTLYGPGGSYNPDEGSLLLFTTPQGQFKSYDNPANTIIHEIVHIGIEESIIGQHNVPHALKERIVDTFVSLHFGQYLPDYRVQEMGDTRTDAYLKSVADFEELDKVVEQVLK